jgi:hypothetical protein
VAGGLGWLSDQITRTRQAGRVRSEAELRGSGVRLSKEEERDEREDLFVLFDS